MGSIYLVRHGQASYGHENYDQLSNIGMQQATMLGNYFHHESNHIDSLISGGLHRQQQSAEAFTYAAKEVMGSVPELRIDAGFNEFDADALL